MKNNISQLKKFLIDHADEIPKLATQHHKEFIGGEKFRSEIIKKYQNNHNQIVRELAQHLEQKDIKKGLAVFKKLGETIARDSVNDTLHIEEAADGIIFLKQALFEKVEEEGLLKELTAEEFYRLSHIVGIYIDTVSSKIAFTYHEDYLQKIAYEVEKRKKTELSIQIAQTYAENIVDTVREPLLVLDKELKVISANKSFYRDYHVAQKQTVGKRIYDLGNGQWNIPALRRLLEEILPQKKIIDNFEVEHTFPIIGHKVMLLNARQLADLPMILLAIDDTTERKKTEQARDRYLKELGRSNSELEQFAYIASHDLQEPLRMVVSYLQLLENRYSTTFDEKAKRWINFAVDGGKRMQILLSELLAYSRIATKAKPLEKTNLNTILQDVLSDLEAAINESKVKIIAKNLPIVTADPVQMGQLLQNLMSNAIKFRNKSQPLITIASEHSDNKWTISVKDNGIGIDSEYYEKIFTIFQRLHTREEYPGTGIGLAVCKKIVERHQGEIWVESEQGKGTTFFFSLPAGRQGISDNGGDKQ